MQTVITCSSCQSRLTMPAAVAGSAVQCPRCGVVFTAPATGDDTAPPRTSPPPPVSSVSASLPAAEPEPQPPTGSWTPPRAADIGGYDQPFLRLKRGEELPAELPGRIRAIVAMFALGFSVLGAAAALGIAALALEVAEGPRSSRFEPFPPQPPTFDPRQDTYTVLIGTTELVNLAAQLASGIAFLVWIYSAHDNLRLLGSGHLEYSPGWAIGYFFIPILSLFRPYQVVQEIHKASKPDLPFDRPGGWRVTSGSSVIGWWWGCWIFRALLSGCAGGFDFERRSQFFSHERLMGMIAAHALTIAAGVLAIFMIKHILDRQTVRFEKVLMATGTMPR